MEPLHIIRNRTAALCALGGISLATLTACGGNEIKIKSGVPATVEQHIDYPAHTSYSLIGKIFVPINHAEEFDLLLKQCDQTECIEQEVPVTQDTYNSYSDGSTIILQ